MCGRYTLTRQKDLVEDLEASLGDSAQGEWWKPRFNVAPTQPAPVVIAGTGDGDGTGGRTVELMRWGLLPHWAGKSGSKPPLMINARVETIREKPMYRDALARKRCLVPADGFFEWKRDGKTKLPMYIHPEPRRTIAFAGLWARMRVDTGLLYSFTIITGPPNTLVAPIHDRMPVVLDPASYAAWLDPSLDAAAAHALLGVPSIDGWTVELVSSQVNSAKNDDPSLIEPVENAPAKEQGDLFD